MPYGKDAWGYRRLRRTRRAGGRARRKVGRKTRKMRKATRGPYRAKLGKALGMVSIPFPQKTYTTFTYTDNRLLQQGSAGTVANYQYCINDIYDPNYTGAGGQPKYFDTLLGASGGSAPYTNFKVHGAKIKVTFYSYTASTVSDVECFVGLQPSTSISMVPTDMEDILTTPYLIHRAQGQTQNSRPITISKYVKVKNVVGFKDLDDTVFQGAQNASPSYRALFNVGFLSVDGTAQGVMNIVVQIKYFVELSSVNKPADS